MTIIAKASNSKLTQNYKYQKLLISNNCFENQYTIILLIILMIYLIISIDL